MPALKGRSRGHGDCHHAKHTKHNKVKKMSSPQSSFSVQCFPLKPDHLSPDSPSSSFPLHSQQIPPNSYPSALAGPSSTKSTFPDGSSVNLTSCPKDRSDEELQITQQTAAGCVESSLIRLLLIHATQDLQPVLQPITLLSYIRMWTRLSLT